VNTSLEVHFYGHVKGYTGWSKYLEISKPFFKIVELISRKLEQKNRELEKEHDEALNKSR